MNNLKFGDVLVSQKDFLQSSPIMKGERITIVEFYGDTINVLRNDKEDTIRWSLDGKDYGKTFILESQEDIVETSPRIDGHYDFFYNLNTRETQSQVLKVDPYFVSKQWRIGERDPSGALFHILKTVARFGDKNPPEREIKAIYLQIKRLAELEGVELE